MKVSFERLAHFQCELCNKWWSIGDAPIKEKQGWYCPWCGTFQIIKEVNNRGKGKEGNRNQEEGG